MAFEGEPGGYNQMDIAQIELVTALPFGKGLIGREGFVADSEEGAEFFNIVESCVVPITIENTAGCVDGRRIIAFGDGLSDPREIEKRVTPSLPGGLVLAATKAAVGADLLVVRDSKDFQDAYEKMYDLLISLEKEDGGHMDCGASATVEKSVADEIPKDILISALPILRPQPNNVVSLFAANAETKRRKLENGFYGEWSPGWHEDHLSERSPKNFAILQTDDTLTHGHHELAVVAVEKPGYSVAINKLISITGGDSVFGLTTHNPSNLVMEIANKIGGSELERARFLLEFDVDGPQVLNGLVTEGMLLAKAA